MSSVLSPVPTEHPLMQAWTAYKATDDYANTRKWAMGEQHVDGSLWAAFAEGFNAAQPPAQAEPTPAPVGEYPPLPEPDAFVAMSGAGSVIIRPQDFHKWGSAYKVFTADQMRSYLDAYRAQHQAKALDGVEPIGYIAWRDGKPAWSEDCVCEDAVYPRDIEDDCTSMAIYPASTVAALKARIAELEALSERLKLEAQAHAMEARTANSTIAEIYQCVTGSTGEPGNWHGAEPVRARIAELEQDAARYRWLRSQKRLKAISEQPYIGIDSAKFVGYWGLAEDEADEAIDAARKESK